MTLHTQYSGKGTAESAFSKLGRGMVIANLMEDGTPRWNIGTAVENSSFAQQVLLGHDDCSIPAHVYTDLNAMVAPGVLQEMCSVLAPPAASRESKVQAYEAMGRALCRDLANTFAETCPCVRHPGGGCVLRPLLSPGSCNDDNALQLWIAGTSCVNFSKLGCREGTAGDAMRPLKIWGALVNAARPHIVIHEIVPSADAEDMLAREIGDFYKVHCLKINPLDLGYPCDRMRQISICVRRDGMHFVDPGLDLFIHVFKKRVVLPGSALWECPSSYTNKIMRGKAASQGYFFPEGQDVAWFPNQS